MSVIFENTLVCKVDNLPEIKRKLKEYVGHSLVEHYKDKDHALISFDTNGDFEYFGDGPLLTSDEYLIKEVCSEDQDICTKYGDTEIKRRVSSFIKNGIIFPKLTDEKRNNLIHNIRYWFED